MQKIIAPQVTFGLDTAENAAYSTNGLLFKQSVLGNPIILQNEIVQKGDFPTRNINNLVNAHPYMGVEFLNILHIL